MMTQNTNPLTPDQIRKLNNMFGDKIEYEANMGQLWLLRSFVHNEAEKRNWEHAGLVASFNALNNLIDALLPSNGSYYPGYGLELWDEYAPQQSHSETLQTSAH